MAEVKKFLIIDDEDSIQSILSAFLQRYADSKGFPCEIKTLSDPIQGLFELSSSGAFYSAVLLDVRLPNLTGDAIYTSMESVQPDLLERITFVTGFPEDLRGIFPNRKLKILKKPFRYETFATAMDEVIK